MKAMTLLATSIGKNVWFYVQMVNEDVQHLHVYEPWRQRRHLGLQKYTWNTPASKDLSTGKGWRNRPPRSLSLWLSLPCASFTRTTPGVRRRLNPSVRIIHWRAAAESQRATLGASLLGGIIQMFFCHSLSTQSPPLPETPQRLRKSVPSVERV